MKNTIQKYTPKAYCKLIDGEIIYFDLKLLSSKLKDWQNKNPVIIGVRGVWPFQIADMGKYESKNTIEEIISNLPKDIRDKVKEKEKEFKRNLGRGFRNVEQLQVYINKYSNIN